jgi:hypothetical protein
MNGFVFLINKLYAENKPLQNNLLILKRAVVKQPIISTKVTKVLLKTIQNTFAHFIHRNDENNYEMRDKDDKN